MKTQFYKTLPYSIVDSMLIKNNTEEYVRLMPYANICTTPETKYHWKKQKGTTQNYFTELDMTDVCVRGNIQEIKTVSKGFNKEMESRAIKSKSDEQFLYDFLISKNQTKNSIFDLGIDYELEHIFPFDENMFKTIMLWKLIEGCRIMSNENILITEEELKLVKLNQMSLKDVGKLLITYFNNRIIRISLNDNCLELNIPYPMYDLEGGPGYFRFDLNGPNQLDILNNVVNYHKELIIKMK